MTRAVCRVACSPMAVCGTGRNDAFVCLCGKPPPKMRERERRESEREREGGSREKELALFARDLFGHEIWDIHVLLLYLVIFLGSPGGFSHPREVGEAAPSHCLVVQAVDVL